VRTSGSISDDPDPARSSKRGQRRTGPVPVRDVEEVPGPSVCSRVPSIRWFLDVRPGPRAPGSRSRWCG